MGTHVKIDVYQLEKDLGKLEESIRKMESTFNQMESSINSLKSKWTGEAADEFAKYFDEEKVVYDSMIGELDNLKERLADSQRDYLNAKNELRDLIDSFNV
jgi:hypothetical protein